MSFFDKLGKTISDTTHTVVEKTKSSTDTIRLNGLINDEEKNINTAYLNMGKKYAELHTDSAEPEFQEFLDAIAASQSKIEEYREQIRRNKHQLICQSCGAEIPEAVLFCTKCGAENPVGKRLAEERAAKEAAERAEREAQEAARQAAAQQPTGGAEVCPACGKPRMAGAMFCTFCGNRFVAAESAPAPAVVTPVPEEAPAAQPAEPEVITAPAAEESPVIPAPAADPMPAAVPEEAAPEAPAVPERLCPNCGKPVPEHNKFCTSCGTKVEDEASAVTEAVTAAAPEAPSAPERICPNCGKPVPAQNKFCTSCGTKVED